MMKERHKRSGVSEKNKDGTNLVVLEGALRNCVPIVRD